jgi:hypothetical protein
MGPPNLRDMLARAGLQDGVRVRPSIRFKSAGAHGKLPPFNLRERNMALIECYECKRSISSKPACIHCGAPHAQHTAQAAATISFGSLPRNKSVPEAFVPPPAPSRRRK